MARRTDAIISLAWLVAVVVLGVALVAGALQVASNFTATNAYRWVMALLFLGGSMAWLTVYYRDTLRRFFRRS